MSRQGLLAWLERRFRLTEARTTIRTEAAAGLTTYFTLSYILFVQPVVMAAAGVPAEGALFATCVASAAACFLMAWWANYPIALAPGMGSNFYFSFTVCLAMGFTWQEALTANAIAGACFLVLARSRFRERVIEALPLPLRHATAAGIGLLIAMVGFRWGGLIAPHPATYVTLGELGSPVALLALFGLTVTSALLALRVRAAILLGLLATAAAGGLGTRLFDLEPSLITFHGVAGSPPSPAGSAFHLDFGGLFERPPAQWVSVILVFLILDLFDTVGTLVGVGEKAGLLDDRGTLPRAGGAFLADATGTVIGACLGTSTITSYVESAAGVASGGRTGLVAVVTGVCLLLSLVLSPLVQTIGGAVTVEGVDYHPVLAPVLILIGTLMMGSARHISWDDALQAVPAFLTILVMPLSLSITDGLSFGVISFSLLAVATGRPREAPILLHVLALLLFARYAFLT